MRINFFGLVAWTSITAISIRNVDNQKKGPSAPPLPQPPPHYSSWAHAGAPRDLPPPPPQVHGSARPRHPHPVPSRSSQPPRDLPPPPPQMHGSAQPRNPGPPLPDWVPLDPGAPPPPPIQHRGSQRPSRSHISLEAAQALQQYNGLAESASRNLDRFTKSIRDDAPDAKVKEFRTEHAQWDRSYTAYENFFGVPPAAGNVSRRKHTGSAALDRPLDVPSLWRKAIGTLRQIPDDCWKSIDSWVNSDEARKRKFGWLTELLIESSDVLKVVAKETGSALIKLLVIVVIGLNVLNFVVGIGVGWILLGVIHALTAMVTGGLLAVAHAVGTGSAGAVIAGAAPAMAGVNAAVSSTQLSVIAITTAASAPLHIPLLFAGSAVAADPELQRVCEPLLSFPSKFKNAIFSRLPKSLQDVLTEMSELIAKGAKFARDAVAEELLRQGKEAQQFAQQSRAHRNLGYGDAGAVITSLGNKIRALGNGH
eukprot:TRINITY_DN2128_c0_g1_i1.p1 TRINITY_DN2128_c0_g1~~TRINITY_DN2128_c0_g1_i1.p1  ORF type:complete len:480 (+),score=26.91 TRINITY_DN2128_c0_g1_i1:79-1518(+)